MICINISNQQEMDKISCRLGKIVEPGDMICMTGDLGAGKTTFTQGMAKGLGVTDYVTSPTFTIVHEYEGRIPLYHFDVYRIEDVGEMEDIGYEEYFYGSGVSVIEWASLIDEILPKDRLWIEIKIVEEGKRQLCLTGTNHYYHKMIEELLKK